MDDAASVAIAKEVTSKLTKGVDDGKFVAPFTPDRNYAEWDAGLTQTDLMQISVDDELRVDVVSHTTEQEAERSARGKLQFNCPIDIAVRKKFKLVDQYADSRIEVEAIDRLVLLTQQIHVFFTSKPEELLVFESGVHTGTRIMVNPLKEHLRTPRQFTSILRLTFRADVSLI